MQNISLSIILRLILVNQREILCLLQYMVVILRLLKLLVENNIDTSIKYSGDNMKDMDAYAEIAEYLKQYWMKKNKG